MPAVDLQVSTRLQDNRTVVAAAGEIDLYTAPTLQAQLTDVIRDGPAQVVIDLSGVEFCDSTGMNVLLVALKRVRERDGSLVLAGPQSPVRRILEITGLDTVFAVYPTVDEAVQRAGSPET